jgi:hypothetical protein
VISVSAAMADLRDRIAFQLGPGARPVVVDPTRTASTPCVLVEVPQLEPSGTLCGDVTFRHTLLVIGQPGAWAELQPLSDLLYAVLNALDELGIGWTLAEPVTYVPLVQDGQADPCMSYRITVEEFS